MELVELVHFLSMKSKKRLAYDVLDIRATNAGLVHDVTEVDRTGGFFLACEDFGRMFDNLFPACAFFFFLKWRLAGAY